jgi:hypothetical protein
LFLAILPALPAWPQSPALFPDPTALAAELRRLSTGLDEGHGTQIAAQLPSIWAVEAGGHHYSIATRPLRNALESAGADPERARTWIANLELQLDSYATAPPAAPTAAARLQAILSRREFAGVKPPAPWELLWQAIVGWIYKALRDLLSFVGGDSTGGKVLFAIAAIAAIVFLEAWLLGLWRKKRGTLSSAAQPPAPAWTWQRWAILAREAADRGDTRTAIHCCYWAAVVRLQDLRLLPADLTHTPREYLRLLPRRECSHEPLAFLTAALERCWYANRPAAPNDLSQSLNHLEALGCRL